MFAHLRTLAPLVSLLVAILACLSANAADQPNVLFVAIDDLRPEVGAYGHDHVKTPNLDRLARAGLVFNRAYCQQAVCLPSRASFMTGTRPDTTHCWDNNTHFRTALPDVVTLGQHFKNHGYFVQGKGKIYHLGFDDSATWSVPWERSFGHYASAENKAGNGSRPATECLDVADSAYEDGRVAEMAVEALRELGRKPEPFFLAVGFVKPHLPFAAPKKYWDLYDPARIALALNKFRPKGAPPYAITRGGELNAYKDIPEGPISDELARKLKHGYYAATSYMDAQLGKVLDELDRLGLREKTIVIAFGDHGWKLGEHDAWSKATNTENDTNSPLILSVPGMKHAGVRTDALVEFVDLYPTLAELAGLPLPEHLEGVSFKPVLDDPFRPWKQAAFSQYPRRLSDGRKLMGYSMRTDRYRFTAWVDRDDHSNVDAIELYDHQIDPREDTNLAAEPGHAALVSQLMKQWRAGWRGALPGKKANRR